MILFRLREGPGAAEIRMAKEKAERAARVGKPRLGGATGPVSSAGAWLQRKTGGKFGRVLKHGEKALEKMGKHSGAIKKGAAVAASLPFVYKGAQAVASRLRRPAPAAPMSKMQQMAGAAKRMGGKAISAVKGNPKKAIAALLATMGTRVALGRKKRK